MLFLAFPFCSFAIENQIRFEQISVPQGLSHKKVQCIIQDKIGYLWIGTQIGLNRFDGQNFKVFKSNPTTENSLTDNNISALKLDQGGKIWIGTKRGLNLYDPKRNKFEFIPLFGVKDERHSGLEIVELITDKEQNIWVLTEKGISQINPKNLSKLEFKFENSRTTANKNFSSIAFQSGFIWLAGSNGIYNFDPKKRRFNKILSPFHTPIKISKYLDSSLLVTEPTGISHFNTTSKEVKLFWSNEKVEANSILKTSNSGTWIGTNENSIFQIVNTKLKQHWLYSNNPESNKSKNMLCLFEDNIGIIWIGTADQGLFKMDPYAQFFKNQRIFSESKTEIQNPNILSIEEDQNQNLWIGTEKGVFNFINKIKTYKSIIYNGLPLPQCNSIVASENTVLAGTISGLYEIEGNSVRKINLGPSKNKVEISTLEKDINRNIWIGTQNDGVCLWEKSTNKFTWIDQKIRHNQTYGQLLSDRISKILCDADGKVWIGTNKGLNLIEPGKAKIQLFRNEPGNSLSIPIGTVSPMLFDSAKNLWIATKGSGICKLKPNSQDFTIYNEFHGLGNNYISSIVQADKHSLWISTEKGIDRFDIESQLFSKYGLSDGLPFEDFSDKAACKTTDGKILFGGLDGILTFNPKKVFIQNYRPKVQIASLEILHKKIEFKKPISELKEIVLGNKQNYFSIGFAVLNFHFPLKTRIYYRLKGLENEWIEAENKREISYSNLDYKDYIFEVKAINSEGMESDIARMPIILIPPYWKTDAFKIISTFCFIFLMFIIYRTRIYGIAKRNKRLEYQVSKRTNELIEKNKWIEAQAKEILEDKELLQENNRKLWSNIAYGNKIQRAILPDIADIQIFMPDTFVVYLPKDVVSGDLYWFAEKQNRLLLAAIDCTGHGVPGAFMSLIGYEKLNKIVFEEGIETPSLILNSLERKLQKMLKQDSMEAGSTDGMELSLVAIEKDFSKLSFAGAHRPMYLVREGELIEYKGNNFGVGGGFLEIKNADFTEQIIDIQSGDMIYLFSDGFVGQFDSETGRKYLTKNFRELIKTVSSYEAERQKRLIQHELRSFAKASPQIDDILVFGFRIP